MTLPLLNDPRRLQAFAYITELENDLRSILGNYLFPLHGVQRTLGEECMARAQARKSKEYSDVEHDVEDYDLANYVDLGDAIQIIHRWRSDVPTSIQHLLRTRSGLLEGTVPIRNRVMHARPLEFDDAPYLTDMATQLCQSDTALWRGLRLLRKNLKADPSAVFAYKDVFSPHPPPTIHNNLPGPDFDDTGFLGRHELLVQLSDAVDGPFPIIMILGFGGYGKSALALKYCYDLLDRTPQPFDSILWYSAKANTLTATEIVSLSNEIESSTSLLSSIADDMSATDRSPLETITEWMRHFRTLLVIDNLETIMDRNIELLARAIPQGSKIIFTSRIGMPGYGFPIDVPPLTDKEASRYFRRVAKVWQVNQYAQAPEPDVKRITQRLQSNPLFIKWFIQAARSGERADRLLAEPKLVLEYCVQNVLDHLTADATSLLETMTLVTRPCSIAALSYISELAVERTEAAIQELLSHNIAIPHAPLALSTEESFSISNIVSLYVRSYITISKTRQSSILSRAQRIIQAGEVARASNAGLNPYSPSRFYFREDVLDSDVIVAEILKSALVANKRGDIDTAVKLADRAAQINPSYFEVYRVRAHLEASSGDIVRSDATYRHAVSLAPDHAPLRFFYSSFLLSVMKDPSGALLEIDAGLAIDGDSRKLLTNKLRCHLYLGDFDSFDRVSASVPIAGDSSRDDLQIVDLKVQRFVRALERCWLDKDVGQGISQLESLLALLSEGAVERLIDSRTAEHLRKADQHALNLRKLGTIEQGSITTMINQLASIRARIERNIDLFSAPSARIKGRIDQIYTHKNFGFVRDELGRGWFFYRGFLERPELFDSAKIGDSVDFVIGSNNKGPCADKVRLLESG